MRSAGAIRGADGLSRRAALRAVLAGSVPRLPTLGHAMLGGPSPPGPSAAQPHARGMARRRIRRGPGHCRTMTTTTRRRRRWRATSGDRSHRRTCPRCFDTRTATAWPSGSRPGCRSWTIAWSRPASPCRTGSRSPMASRRWRSVARCAESSRTPVLERRDKVAFRTPQHRWLTEALPKLQPTTLRPRSEAQGLVRAGTFSAAFDAFSARRIDDTMLWRLVNLEMWLRMDVRPDA